MIVVLLQTTTPWITSEHCTFRENGDGNSKADKGQPHVAQIKEKSWPAGEGWSKRSLDQLRSRRGNLMKAEQTLWQNIKKKKTPASMHANCLRRNPENWTPPRELENFKKDSKQQRSPGWVTRTCTSSHRTFMSSTLH